MSDAPSALDLVKELQEKSHQETPPKGWQVAEFAVHGFNGQWS